MSVHVGPMGPSEYLTAYTNYWRELGNQYWDKLSIYAFSLLRRPDHSASALALCRLGCTRIVADCIVQSMRRNDRGVHVVQPQIWMRVAAAEARNSRTFRSRGYRLPPASSASITIKRFDRGPAVSFCEFIADADHMKQRRPPSTECRPATRRRSVRGRPMSLSSLVPTRVSLSFYSSRFTAKNRQPGRGNNVGSRVRILGEVSEGV